MSAKTKRGRRRRRTRTTRRRRRAYIKSNNPHLTGGEKRLFKGCLASRLEFEVQLASERNIDQVLSEFREYASEVRPFRRFLVAFLKCFVPKMDPKMDVFVVFQ